MFEELYIERDSTNVEDVKITNRRNGEVVVVRDYQHRRGKRQSFEVTTTVLQNILIHARRDFVVKGSKQDWSYTSSKESCLEIFEDAFDEKQFTLSLEGLENYEIELFEVSGSVLKVFRDGEVS